MKYTSKYNAGFTLIELVVAISIAVVVTAAATSVLLMGLRINRQTGDTASQQMTVRSLLSVVEKAAADGNIKGVISNHASWELVNVEIENDKVPENYRAVFGFDAINNRIYTGKKVVDGVVTEGTTVLEGVYASNVTIEGDLLTVSVETMEGIFSTSIYCRVTDLKDDSVSNNLPDTTAVGDRGEFIKKLQSQYRSRGEIVYTGDIVKDPGDFDYYSEWYIGGYSAEKPDWNEKTPWCACFVSWALDQINMKGPAGYCPKKGSTHNHGKWFADVDEFMAYFQDESTTTSRWQDSQAHGGTYPPEPGDLIFFDWDKGTDPEHVGVVLEVKTNGGATIIYTIEGNSSGRVAIRSYTIGDPRIIGYGVLPWGSE